MYLLPKVLKFFNQRNITYLLIFFFLLVVTLTDTPINILSNLKRGNVKNVAEAKSGYEIFGFAPHWTFNKLDNVDFNILTTFAYFGIPVLGDGSLDKDDVGYTVFHSDRATKIFQKAHSYGTRVVLTITQMNNDDIKNFLDSDEVWDETISEITKVVKKRGIDGINVDFEYVGNPGNFYKVRFTDFVERLTRKMHREDPLSKVTVSVYASSVKMPKMYDVPALAKATDGIFMMAYDFATTSSDNAMPTSPLYGYKEGEYWYDVSTAVDDFLDVISKDKLILGIPWYGYNYPVYSPKLKAEVNPGYYTYYWYRKRQYSQFHAFTSLAQTYSIAQDISDITTGWDDYGKVGYKAYMENGVWRMVFMEDSQSLGIKYDFAKEKSLKGIGIWALGFDHGRTELWDLLSRKFGSKLARSNL